MLSEVVPLGAVLGVSSSTSEQPVVVRAEVVPSVVVPLSVVGDVVAPSPPCLSVVLPSLGIIRLPCWSVAGGKRGGPRLHLSFVAQMDGLIYSLFGVRVERDVFAPSLALSFCQVWGAPDWVSWSSFVGLFYAAPEAVESVVATAMSHQACGLFIVPVWPSHGREIVPASKVLKGGTWFSCLREHALLEFAISGPVCTGGEVPAYGLRGFFSAFNYAGRFKSKRRQERLLVVSGLPFPADDGGSMLGVCPFVPTRISPLVSTDMLLPAVLDTCDGTPPLPISTLLSPLPPPPAYWKVPIFEQWASKFPCKRIAQLAVQAVSGGMDIVFAGDQSKAVMRPNSTSIHGKESVIRESLVVEVAEGRVAGPFASCPFPSVECPMQPRSVPLSATKKKKHDPTDDRIRVVCDFSAGGPGSVNELFWRPKFISFHCRARHIRDVLAAAQSGSGRWRKVRAWGGDIPCCFRHQRNRSDLLPLFVYHLSTVEFGKEFWVDLANPFGWRASEWGWQAVLAVINWELWSRGFTDVLTYVDNFFLVSPEGGMSIARECELIRVLGLVGISLHEIQDDGGAFNGLGWDWVRSQAGCWFMVCPADKKVIMCGYLSSWADVNVSSLSLTDCRKAVGLLEWISDGFPVGKPDVSPLVGMRTAGEAMLARRPSLSPVAVMVPFTPHAKEAVSFWALMFGRWDGRCQVIENFGPHVSWQCLAQVDASTDWGCGGFVLSPAGLVGFAHEWTADERSLAFVNVRESTGLLELMAAEWLFVLLGQRCEGFRLELDMDNRESARSLQSGFSPKPLLLSPIRNIWKFCVDSRVVLRVRHVLGVPFNQIADALSHNRTDQALCLAKERFGVEMVLSADTRSRAVTRL
jgi:hypothetical protein